MFSSSLITQARFWRSPRTPPFYFIFTPFLSYNTCLLNRAESGYTKGVWDGRDVGVVTHTQKQIDFDNMKQGVSPALDLGYQMS